MADADTAEQWLSAPSACQYLERTQSRYVAQCALISRAGAGLVRSRAQLQITECRGKRTKTANSPVAAAFFRSMYPAQINGAGWFTGDFEAWLELPNNSSRDTLAMAFGVQFAAIDVEGISPAPAPKPNTDEIMTAEYIGAVASQPFWRPLQVAAWALTRDIAVVAKVEMQATYEGGRAEHAMLAAYWTLLDLTGGSSSGQSDGELMGGEISGRAGLGQLVAYGLPPGKLEPHEIPDHKWAGASLRLSDNLEGLTLVGDRTPANAERHWTRIMFRREAVMALWPEEQVELVEATTSRGSALAPKKPSGAPTSPWTETLRRLYIAALSECEADPAKTFPKDKDFANSIFKITDLNANLETLKGQRGRLDHEFSRVKHPRSGVRIRG